MLTSSMFYTMLATILQMLNTSVTTTYLPCSTPVLTNNKRVVIFSLSENDSVLQVVFATMTLGMGVDFKNLDYIIHYGAPRSLEDYIQESGRAGRDHQQSRSRIYWKLVEAPVYADQSVHRYKELKEVRDYLENTELCRRFKLPKYFDPAVAMTLGSRDSTLCCDNCRSKLQ